MFQVRQEYAAEIASNFMLELSSGFSLKEPWVNDLAVQKIQKKRSQIRGWIHPQLVPSQDHHDQEQQESRGPPG